MCVPTLRKTHANLSTSTDWGISLVLFDLNSRPFSLPTLPTRPNKRHLNMRYFYFLSINNCMATFPMILEDFRFDCLNEPLDQKDLEHFTYSFEQQIYRLSCIDFSAYSRTHTLSLSLSCFSVFQVSLT